MPSPKSSHFRSPDFPNLFIVGALKCGTSSLHRYLSHHPDIFMSDPKEPGTLSLVTDNLDEGVPLMDRRAIQVWNAKEYLDLFSGANTRYRGEASCGYTLGHRATATAALIHELNPEARILYLVRDPFEEMLSHYLMRRRRQTETQELSTALLTDSYLRPTAYGDHVAPFLKHFGRNQVRVIDQEDLRAQTQSTLESVFRWLDLEPSKVDPRALKKRVNVSRRHLSRFPWVRARERWHRLNTAEVTGVLGQISSQLGEHRRDLEDQTNARYQNWLSHRGDLSRLKERFGWALV